eukprot:762693-Ditylum_brightwellii.AAC.2
MGCNIKHTQGLLCNNISAVNKTNDTIPPGVMSHITPDYDIIHEIMEVKPDVSQFKVFWVKAHQENNKLEQELNLVAQLNVLVDADVNAF